MSHANILVRNFPREMNQGVLLSMFRPFGEIMGYRVFTTASTPFAYLKLDTVNGAMMAINALNNQQVENKTLVVKLADTDAEYETPNANLYCINCPPEWTEAVLDELFKPYGNVIYRYFSQVTSTKMLPQALNIAGRCALVRMGSMEEAAAAKRALNVQVPGANEFPLVVKYADTPGDKARKVMYQREGANRKPDRFSPYGQAGQGHMGGMEGGMQQHQGDMGHMGGMGGMDPAQLQHMLQNGTGGLEPAIVAAAANLIASQILSGQMQVPGMGGAAAAGTGQEGYAYQYGQDAAAQYAAQYAGQAGQYGGAAPAAGQDPYAQYAAQYAAQAAAMGPAAGQAGGQYGGPAFQGQEQNWAQHGQHGMAPQVGAWDGSQQFAQQQQYQQAPPGGQAPPGYGAPAPAAGNTYPSFPAGYGPPSGGPPPGAAPPPGQGGAYGGYEQPPPAAGGYGPPPPGGAPKPGAPWQQHDPNRVPISRLQSGGSVGPQPAPKPAANGQPMPMGAPPGNMPSVPSGGMTAGPKAVVVTSLPSNIDRLTLYELFAPFGGLVHVSAPMNGSSWITFSDPATAVKAAKSKHGTQLGESVLGVSPQYPPGSQ